MRQRSVESHKSCLLCGTFDPKPRKFIRVRNEHLRLGGSPSGEHVQDLVGPDSPKSCFWSVWGVCVQIIGLQRCGVCHISAFHTLNCIWSKETKNCVWEYSDFTCLKSWSAHLTNPRGGLRTCCCSLLTCVLEEGWVMFHQQLQTSVDVSLHQEPIFELRGCLPSETILVTHRRD